VEYVGGAAAAAGVWPGDVIVTVGDTPVRGHSDLLAAVAGRRSSERVRVLLLRDAKATQVTLPLTGIGAGLFNGRPDGFPTVIEHDLPLMPVECGGPVVGLDGLVVAVTIARVNSHGCQAIPAEVVLRLLPGLKAGKPLATASAAATTGCACGQAGDPGVRAAGLSPEGVPRQAGVPEPDPAPAGGRKRREGGVVPA
jgi:S1-C subfamily serine protease